MMAQQKQKIQYVDQFRKISTLEKLPTLASRLQNIFEDEAQKQNNNFIRLRKEPIVDKWDNVDHQQVIQSNECVQQCVNNRLDEEKEQYEDENQRVTEHIAMYKKWSDINKKTNRKNETFKFFYRNASPPKNMLDADYIESKKKSKKDNNVDKQLQKIATNIDFINFGNQQFKYDFFQINQKRLEDYLDKLQLKKAPDTENEEQDIFMQAFRKFEKYKTLESISTMDEYKMAEDNFFYDLSTNKAETFEEETKYDKYFLNKFIYKSVTKSLKTTEKDVQYFRDIGLPSRNLDKYSQLMTSRGKQARESFEQQTKEQAHYLHLLRQGQLNINKSEITFEDVSNISNGRVTYLNAYMCIRSEKVTKAQFEKLLKRLDKYKKQQMEKGKQKLNVGVWTEDIQLENNSNQKSMQKEQKNMQKNFINQIINQISQIRQSTVLLQNRKNQDNLHLKQSAFNKEKYTRMLYLLKRLYESIVVSPAKYPFTFLEDYLENVDEILLPQYKNGKILWFVIDCYEEILKNMPDHDNIKTVLKKKPINEPKISTYKGMKLLKEEKLRTTNLYTQNPKNRTSAQVPTNDKSKTPRKSTTPIKTTAKKGHFQSASNLTKKQKR